MVFLDHKVLCYKLRLSFLKLITTQNFFNLKVLLQDPRKEDNHESQENIVTPDSLWDLASFR